MSMRRGDGKFVLLKHALSSTLGGQVCSLFVVPVKTLSHTHTHKIETEMDSAGEKRRARGRERQREREKEREDREVE